MMKRWINVLWILVLTSGLMAQQPELPDTLSHPESATPSKKPPVEIRDNEDTISVKVGKKGVKIYKEDEGTQVEIMPIEKPEKPSKRKRRRNFKGHWEGFEIGMNNFLTPDYSYPDNFMNLNTGKSWNVNLNFIQYDQRLIGNTLGIVTGLGLQLNDYKFSGNHSITRDSTGSVVMLAYADQLKMSKLNVGYLTLPVILEIHAGRSFYVAGGVIGSMKIRSYTKVKMYDQGKITKNKIKDDFAISPLQLSATVRFGIKELNLYANYNLTPLFQENKGPELYPFSVGLAVRFD